MTFRPPLNWKPAVCFLSLFVLPALAVRAYPQSSSDEVTPEVQRLYSEAKAAQSRSDTAAAIAKYRAMIKLAPHLGPAYNNLGMLYFNERDYEKAAAILAQGLAIDPSMNTAQSMLGISQFKLGKTEEAKAALEKAIAANPSDDYAEITLARVLVATGELEAAAGKLRDYLQRNPKDQQAWYLLGKTYLQLSEASLSKIEAIDPNSVTAHEVAGEIDESMHNYDGALAEYNKAVQLGPKEPGTHYHLGNAFWLEEKWDSAKTEFEAELVNDPNNCTTQWKLGNTLIADKQPAEQALPYLSEAVERCPNLMQARVDRANALLKLNQPEKAIDDLLIAEQDSPKEPSIHFLLSRAYKAVGKTDQAKIEIERYGQLEREASEATAGQASDVIQIKNAAH